jgi:hypothetical protein
LTEIAGKRSCYYGYLRDSLFHALGLESIIGLDINPMKTFAGLKGMSLDSLRVPALGLASKELKKQMKRHNTFFLRIEDLEGGPFADLIPLIKEVRKDEVMALSDTPTLKEVITTFYGVEAFCDHSSHQSDANPLSNGKRLFKRKAKSLGKKIVCKGKLLPLRHEVWTNTSGEVHYLLYLLMILSLRRNAMSAANDLGQCCDSRTMRYLEVMRDRLWRGELQHSIALAISQIGKPTECGDTFWLDLANNL